MSTPDPGPRARTDALRAVLRPCAIAPRPIPRLELSPTSRFGATR